MPTLKKVTIIEKRQKTAKNAAKNEKENKTKI